MEGEQTHLGAHAVTAYMIAFDDQHRELIFPVDSKDLRTGDLLLLKEGEQVPATCKILWGEVWIAQTEAATAVLYSAPQVVPGGGLVKTGIAKAYVTPGDVNIY